MDKVKLPPSLQRSKGISLNWKWREPFFVCPICGELARRTSGVQKYCRRCGWEIQQDQSRLRFLTRYRTDSQFRERLLKLSSEWKKKHPDWDKRKRENDPVYRALRLAASKRWKTKNPGYWRKYQRKGKSDVRVQAS